MKGQGKKERYSRARARRSPPRPFDVHKKKERERERERERPFFWKGGGVVRRPTRRKNRVVVKKSHFRAVSLFFSLSLFFEMCLSKSSHYRIARRRAFFLTQNTGVFGVVEEKTEEEEDAR